MTEIERIQDVEIVEDKPSWEELVSEFIEGRRYELHGQLRQARAAANVCRHYGKSSMRQFAGEVGKSAGWCYDLARVWMVYGHIFEGEDHLSSQLETLGISHLVKSLAAPEPVRAAEEAADEELTVRQMEERIQGTPKNVEMITEMVCPECGAVSPMSRVETREVKA